MRGTLDHEELRTGDGIGDRPEGGLGKEQVARATHHERGDGELAQTGPRVVPGHGPDGAHVQPPVQLGELPSQGVERVQVACGGQHAEPAEKSWRAPRPGEQAERNPERTRAELDDSGEGRDEHAADGQVQYASKRITRGAGHEHQAGHPLRLRQRRLDGHLDTHAPGDDQRRFAAGMAEHSEEIFGVVGDGDRIGHGRRAGPVQTAVVVGHHAMPGTETGQERRPGPQRPTEAVCQHHDPPRAKLLHREVGAVMTEDALLAHGRVHDLSM